MRFVITLVLLASGCAIFPLSEADCKPTDWRARGYAEWDRRMGSIDMR